MFGGNRSPCDSQANEAIAPYPTLPNTAHLPGTLRINSFYSVGHICVDCYPTAKAIRLLCIENRQAK